MLSVKNKSLLINNNIKRKYNEILHVSKYTSYFVKYNTHTRRVYLRLCKTLVCIYYDTRKKIQNYF